VLAWHQRRTALRLRSQAMTDELTGVANRRAVLSQLVPLLRGFRHGWINEIFNLVKIGMIKLWKHSALVIA
jgi:GGDEF domain-containing protein